MDCSKVCDVTQAFYLEYCCSVVRDDVAMWKIKFDLDLKEQKVGKTQRRQQE